MWGNLNPAVKRTTFYFLYPPIPLSPYPPIPLSNQSTIFECNSVLNVTIDRDEDGVWIVECPSIPGCVSQGRTKSEALDNIKDAIAACLQVRAALLLPLTIETRQVEVVA